MEANSSDSTQTVGVDVRTYEPPRLDAGSALGRYVVLECVGGGGMGTVYRAYDPKLHREVALKVLRRGPLANEDDREADARLLREARAMAALTHPNVLPVYDVEEAQGQFVLAMEYVEGQTLRHWAAGTKASVAEQLRCLAAVGRGLEAAHAAGVIHRDLKPSNVLVGNDGRVRVLDFGLARGVADTDAAVMEVTDSGEDHGSVGPSGFDGHSGSVSASLVEPLTRAGQILGTPPYMAPELHYGNPASLASDQYAFCVTAYELLYGVRPFRASNLLDLVRAKKQADVPSRPPRGGVHPRIHRAILRGVSPVPGDRWPSMAHLLAELAFDPGARRRRTAGVAAAVLGVAVVGGGGYALSRSAAASCAEVGEGVFDLVSASTLQGVHDGLAGVPAPYAAKVATRVSTSLQDHAGDWAKARTEVCRVTKVEKTRSAAFGEQASVCLERSLGELTQTIAVLSGPNEEVVARADQMVNALSAPQDCLSPARLLESAPEAPAAVAKDVERIRTALLEVTVLQRAGRYADGLARARELGVEAAATAFDPLSAEVAEEEGRLAQLVGEYDAAQDRLRYAYFTALTAGHDTVAAAAAIALTEVLGTRLAKPVEGLAWADHAQALLDRSDAPPLARAHLHDMRGSVLETAGRYGEAVAQGEASVELLLRAQPESFALGRSYNNLGVSYKENRQFDRALESYEAARAIYEGLLGPDHPAVAQIIFNIGTMHDEAGDKDQAIINYKHALATNELALGPEHPDTGAALANLAGVHADLGKMKEAITYGRRAVEVLEKALPGHHPNLIVTRFILAGALRTEGKASASVEQLEKAVAAADKLGEDHPLTISGHVELGRSLRRAGEFARAVEELEVGLAGRVRIEERPASVAEARFDLARARHGLGQTERARADGQAARALLDGADESGVQSLRTSIDAFLESPGDPAGP